jgi:hypothetical protein
MSERAAAMPSSANAVRQAAGAIKQEERDVSGKIQA